MQAEIETTEANNAPNSSISPQGFIPGAQWRSVDFHVHSPASFDFGGLKDGDETAAKPSYTEWLEAIVESGLDGIVLADHNTGEGIDEARRALAQLSSARPGLDFKIFPGVELTAHDGIHILAIFDPVAPASIVNDLLVKVDYKGKRGASDSTSDSTPAQIAEKVKALGGICVPAHADGPRGLFGLDERELYKFRGGSDFHAVEVIADDTSHKFKNMALPAVLGSDMHHLVAPDEPIYVPDSDELIDPKFPGSHYTWVKTERLDLTGLKIALLDPTHCILRARQGDRNPNESVTDRITCLRVAFGKDVSELAFSPWMTCLIGGRGVGKSTIIELLRLALGRTHELGGSVGAELSRFSLNTPPHDRWWDDQTRITVDFVRSNMPHRAHWAGSDPTRHVIERFEGGEWIEQTGRIRDRFPVRIYSQKQIFQMASEPQSFLRVLDETSEVGKADWDAQHSELLSKFREKRQKLRQVLAKESEVETLKGQLQDFTGRMAAFDELSESDEFKEYTALHAKMEVEKTVELAALDVEREAQGLAGKLRGLDLAPFGAEYQDRRREIEESAALIESAAAKLNSSRDSWNQSGTLGLWSARLSTLQAWLRENSPAALQEHGIADIQEATLAVRSKLDELTAEIAATVHIRAELDSDIIAIRASERTLFERRERFAESLKSDVSSTEVKVYHQAQLEPLEEDLRRLLRRSDAYDSVFGEDGIPAFFRGIHPKDPRSRAMLDEFREGLVELVTAGSASKFSRRFNLPRRFMTHLESVDAFEVETEILLWAPEDRLEVHYKPHANGNFVPVDRGSPGQKTAALLAVILQMGSEPLLLDQPEDDLENKLINKLVVNTLRAIKLDRQIIVATHNANIVVTSGAEHIISFTHGPVPIVGVEGSIQMDAVREEVCEIVEGGEEAIRTRYRRLIQSNHSSR